MRINLEFFAIKAVFENLVYLTNGLEPQFREEPSVFAFLVPFFESGTDEMASLLLLHGVLQDFLVQVSLIEADVDAVASGHQVVVVDDLQEFKILKNSTLKVW